MSIVPLEVATDGFIITGNKPLSIVTRGLIKSGFLTAAIDFLITESITIGAHIMAALTLTAQFLGISLSKTALGTGKTEITPQMDMSGADLETAFESDQDINPELDGDTGVN